MIRLLVVFSILVGGLSALAEETTRTWTSADGRKIEAKLISAEPGGRIELELGNGKSIDLNAAQLSADDQIYVQQFLKAIEEEAGPLGLEAAGKIPPSFRGRCLPMRRADLLATAGVSNEHEQAVVNGLEFLKAQQNPDGSFGEEFPVAMTGLALLAYLGHCEGPNSADFGNSVVRAALYLMEISSKSQGGVMVSPENGKPGYENGIATYALAELLAFSNALGSAGAIPKLESTVKKGIKVIVDGQGSDGGWVYKYAKGGAGDSCLSGWQVQALLAAHEAGLEKETATALDHGFEYYRAAQLNDGGTTYRRGSGTSKTTLSAIAPYARQRWFAGPEPSVEMAMEYLDKNVLGKGSAQTYSWYFATHAYALEGGEDWKKWSAYSFEKVIAGQVESGAFSRLAGGHGPKEPATKDIYSTTLAVLILESPYRYVVAKR